MAMRPNQLKEFLKKCLVKMPHRAIFVSGPVGIGKSECVQQVVQELGWELTDIRLSLLDPTDLLGLPAIDKEKRQTIWTRPAFLPDPKDTKKRVLFFDEFNTAMKSMQNASLQLMLSRRLGEYPVPENTRIICAGNRIIDVGGFVSKLSPALSNRLINIEFEANFEDWMDWALAHRMHPLVLGYHNFTHGIDLNVYKAEVDDAAFPTSRTWAFIGLPGGILDLELANGTRTEAIVSTIGKGVGVKFVGYLKVYQDLPDPKDILLKGKDIIPKGTDVMYALCATLVHMVQEHQDKLDRLVEYSMKLKPEFSAVLITDLLRVEGIRNKLMTESEAFTKWVALNKEVLRRGK